MTYVFAILYLFIDYFAMALRVNEMLVLNVVKRTVSSQKIARKEQAKHGDIVDY